MVTISLIPSVLRGLCRNIEKKIIETFPFNWFALHKRKVSVEVIPLLPRFTADVSKIRPSGWFHVKVVVTKTLPSSQLLNLQLQWLISATGSVSSSGASLSPWSLVGSPHRMGVISTA